MLDYSFVCEFLLIVYICFGQRFKLQRRRHGKVQEGECEDQGRAPRKKAQGRVPEVRASSRRDVSAIQSQYAVSWVAKGVDEAVIEAVMKQ